MSAIIPDFCPVAREDGKLCQISVNHHRDRKTGPCFPLAVVKCRTHDLCFTLYPPGHYPYGRQPLVNLIDANGEDVKISTDEFGSHNPLASFSGTLFDAALDADKSLAWVKESFEGSFQPRFNTQLRQLDKTARLLGIHETLGSRQRESITEILDLPGQLVAESFVGLNHSPTFKKQGQAICQLLREVLKNVCLFERLTETGSIAGLWPPPYFWIDGIKRLKKGSFHLPGIRGSPC